ncbi:hypothetical protein PG984_014074 [Apiospora sp. TS-2023a]
MAILAEIPGIQAVVKVDGRLATEYPDPDPEHRRAILCPVSCVYIESVDDAPFTVELVADGAYNFARDEEHYLHIRVDVDGERYGIAGCEINKDQVAASQGGKRVCLDEAGERRGAHVFFQKFRFATMKRARNNQKSDHVGKGTTPDYQKELGIIRVHVYRQVKRFRESHYPPFLLPFTFNIFFLVLTIGVSREANERAARRTTDYVRGDFGPFATYKFLYRPKVTSSSGILEEALANILPTPSPSAVAVAQSVRQPSGRDSRRQSQLDAGHGGRRAPPRPGVGLGHPFNAPGFNTPGAMSIHQMPVGGGSFRIKKRIGKARAEAIDPTSD